MLRKATYRRLRRHWQFMNALMLFEVHDQVSYGVHVYRGEGDPTFLQATSLYHPSTMERSLEHDGSGSEPGLKDDEGHWDLRPHASRIQRVDEATLKTWHAVLEDEAVPFDHTRMVYTVNRATAAVLDKLAAAPSIGSLGLQFSAGLGRMIDRTKGSFDSEWGVPESWDSVILQGPHFHVGTPFYKSPNPTMLHNQDWTAVDLEALPPDAVPATQYKPRGDRTVYDAAYTHWATRHGPIPARRYYRVAWRAMAANTGERTLIACLVPPGVAHPHTVSALGAPAVDLGTLAEIAGFMSSLVVDFLVRAVPKSGILMSTIEKLPIAVGGPYSSEIIERVLRLNALTSAYAPLWEEVTGTGWTPDMPLRGANQRRIAQIEIDALVALSLDVSIDELITIYRTQFPVLRGYDRDDYLFDSCGRLVPTEVRQAWKRAGEPTGIGHLGPDEFSRLHLASGRKYAYKLPFGRLDRESDLRSSYVTFESRYAKRA